MPGAPTLWSCGDAVYLTKDMANTMNADGTLIASMLQVAALFAISNGAEIVMHWDGNHDPQAGMSHKPRPIYMPHFLICPFCHSGWKDLARNIPSTSACQS